MKDKGIVITIHGLLRTKFSMICLGKQLENEGYEVHHFGYRSRQYSIGEISEQLYDFISSRFKGSEKLNFVTHSLGSIVLRKFILSHPEEFNLGRAVMLGPPNRGSDYARRISKIPHIVKILGPAFLELCDLNLSEEAKEIEIGIVAGGTKGSRGMSPLIDEDNDGAVKVEETGLKGAKERIIIYGWHSFLVYKKTVIKEMLHFLDNGRFSENSYHHNP